MEEMRELEVFHPLEGLSGERLHVVQAVRRWGGLSTDAVLDPAGEIFNLPGIQGLIGYRKGSRHLIVFGDPICAKEDQEMLTTSFHAFAKKLGKEVIYIASSQSFATWAIQHGCHASLAFGKELIFDPACDPRKMSGTQASLVRRKVKQALKAGVSIHEYVQGDPELQRALENVGTVWVQSRRGVQMHISNVHLFDDCLGKRWFYAKQGNRVIGVLTLNWLESYQGWLLNHLMPLPGAPNGTSELLIVSVFEVLAKEGCHAVTVGTVVASTLDAIAGFSPFSIWMARILFKLARKIVFLDGLYLFWNKFHPNRAEPLYIVFSQGRMTLSALVALKRALSGSL